MWIGQEGVSEVLWGGGKGKPPKWHAYDNYAFGSCQVKRPVIYIFLGALDISLFVLQKPNELSQGPCQTLPPSAMLAVGLAHYL